MERQLTVYYELDEQGSLPEFSSAGSAGLDVTAAETCLVLPGETRLVPTGLKIALPLGCEAQIRPRSGLSLRTSLRIANAPGTIDADYRGEVKIIVENTFRSADLSDLISREPETLARLLRDYRAVSFAEYYALRFGPEQAQVIPRELGEQSIYLDRDNLPFGTLVIERGMRFAQMVVADHHRPRFVRVERVATIGEDRGGGFGSTGV